MSRFFEKYWWKRCQKWRAEAQKRNRPKQNGSMKYNACTRFFLLPEIPIQQPLERLAVTGFVPRHLMHGVLGASPLGVVSNIMMSAGNADVKGFSGIIVGASR